MFFSFFFCFLLLDPFLQRACSIELNYMSMSKVWTPEHCTCSQTIANKFILHTAPDDPTIHKALPPDM